MGRKIPGKKHKGVKDPEKQRAVRQKLLKDKINCPPTNADEQPIPKSLQNIIKLKKKASLKKSTTKIIIGKNDTSVSKTKKVLKVKKPLKRLNPEKPPPKFDQFPGETDRAFLGRVNKTVRDYLKEAQFERKFNVNVVRDSQTGEITGVQKKPKDELEELIKKAKKTKTKKKKSNISNEPKLTKTQKRSKKLAEKKQKKELARIDEFAKYTDTVQFGEIVHAPPTLIAPKKVMKSNIAPRPGQRQLLLKQLSQNKPESIESIKSKKNEKNTVIDMKGKRKELPVAVRRQLETVQNEVMKAYRSLKAQPS